MVSTILLDDNDTFQVDTPTRNDGVHLSSTPSYKINEGLPYDEDASRMETPSRRNLYEDVTHRQVIPSDLSSKAAWESANGHFYNDYRPRRRDSLVESAGEPWNGAQDSVSFDFGSGAKLPPPVPRSSQSQRLLTNNDSLVRRESSFLHSSPQLPNRPTQKSIIDGDHHPATENRKDTHLRSLWRDKDTFLLTYLATRRVSASFLAEIDIFLGNHPDIALYAPLFAETFNESTPLGAYLFFLRGYRRPARYVAGTIPETRMPPLDSLPRMAVAYDEELEAFSEGQEYRQGILWRIDEEVAWLCERQRDGWPMTYEQQVLIGFVAFGNPVDAFKQYQYNYQTERLEDRYLPEHSVLSDLPAYARKTQPLPRTIILPETADEQSITYPRIRCTMAAANDAGVDVIQVLLDAFTVTLVRKGCSRNHIASLEKHAREAIDEQRDYGLGEDIVDLVMDMADNADGRRCLGENRAQKLRRAAAPSKSEIITHRTVPRRAEIHRSVRQVLSTPVKTPSTARVSLRDMLRQHKRSLQRLQRMERGSTALTSAERNQIAGSRRASERHFVKLLVQYLLTERRITSQTANGLLAWAKPKYQRAFEMAGQRFNVEESCPPEI